MIEFRATLAGTKNAIQVGSEGDVRVMLDVHIEDGDKAMELRDFIGRAFVVTIADDPDEEEPDVT